MNRLDWCNKKSNGIKIVDPNKDLSKKYIKKSENSLEMMETAPSEEWEIVGAYYACYNALYALLQRTGIKSEIHDCTIELMNYYDFSKTEEKFIKKLKEKRKKAQYHVTEEVKLNNKNKVKDFVLKCKKILNDANFNQIRKKISKRLKK